MTTTFNWHGNFMHINTCAVCSYAIHMIDRERGDCFPELVGIDVFHLLPLKYVLDVLVMVRLAVGVSIVRILLLWSLSFHRFNHRLM